MSITRRDFLKLGSAASGALAAARLAPHLAPAVTEAAVSRPGILVLVLDAMAAANLSLYGYPRKTVPNLERFAARATVFHQHYSAANFTTPGTASLLTGLYPWTHRAINESGLIARPLAGQNLFRALGSGFHRLAFSQNLWADYLFSQFQHDIESILSPASFSLMPHMPAELFVSDRDDSHRALDGLLLQDYYPPASLVLGLADRLLLRRAVASASGPEYPRGLPRTTNYPILFRIREVFDGLLSTIQQLPEPSLAYLHLWPPHEPYRASREFNGLFSDGWAPRPKPPHRLNDPTMKITEQELAAHRQRYDEYLAEADAEFGRLLDSLDAQGILNRNSLVVTSDHGQMFERGVEGHVTRLLYDPVVRVPLLISTPGQAARRDVHVPTSSVDLLPTLASLTGLDVPAWCEGQVLPGLGGPEDPQRSILMMDAKFNRALAPLTNASIAMRKGRYKLSYYVGFRQEGAKGERYELYDIESDPEEMQDLYSESSPIAAALQQELTARLRAANMRLKRAG